jgi:hypothetical protein
MDCDIKIVQWENPTLPDDIGDFLYPKGDKWFSNVPDEVWIDKPFALIPGCNSWSVLKRIGVDVSSFIEGIKYQCMYTGNTYFWFVPQYIFCADVEFWISRFFSEKVCNRYQFEMYRDQEWMRYHMMRKEDNTPVFDIGKISESMLGHGYTDFAGPSDGYAGLVSAVVNLSNGDYLAGNVWCWYNK